MQREYFTWNIGKSCIFRFHRLYMAILKKRKTILSELWPEALPEPCFASFLLLSLLLFKLLIRAHKPCNIYLKLRKNSVCVSKTYFLLKTFSARFHPSIKSILTKFLQKYGSSILNVLNMMKTLGRYKRQ